MTLSSSKIIALVTGLALFGVAARAQVAVTNEDLPNFHQVDQNFFRGAQPTQEGIRLLASQGVKTIINLRAADEGGCVEEWWTQEAGLRYFNVPMKGTGRPTEAQVQTVLALINAAANQPVFVHCKRGKDRTGTIVACYRIAHDHWTSQQAVAEARKLGMQWSEFGMKRYVRDFYRHQSQGEQP